MRWAHLKDFPNLANICIEYTRNGDDLLESIRGMTGLETLSFHSTRITDRGMALVATFPHLKRLRLCGACCECSPIPLKGHPAIEEIEFEDAAESQVMGVWLDVLKSLPHLRLLEFEFVTLRPDAKKILARALPACSIRMGR